MNAAKILSIFNPTGKYLAAEYWKSKKGKGVGPVCLNKFNNDAGCRIKPGAESPCDNCPTKSAVSLSIEMLQAHMEGRARYGIYPLGQDGLTAWVAADFDNHDGTADPKTDILKILEVARTLEIPVFVFGSNSGNGYHFHIFFEKPIPAWKGRLLLLTLIQRAEVTT